MLIFTSKIIFPETLATERFYLVMNQNGYSLGQNILLAAQGAAKYFTTSGPVAMSRNLKFEPFLWRCKTFTTHHIKTSCISICSLLSVGFGKSSNNNLELSESEKSSLFGLPASAYN